MMQKKRSIEVIVSLLLVGVLNFPILVSAGTIILKSGQKIEAGIIKRTNDYIVIDWHGTVVTYQMNEIESISGKESGFPSYHKRNNSSNYSNVILDLGIRFIPPRGWDESKPPGTSNMVTIVHPHKKATIVIGWHTGFGVSEASFKLTLTMIRTTKKPISEEKITFCNVPCHIFTLEIVDKAGRTGKGRNYLFFKNGKVYNILYVAPIEQFDNYLPEFKKALDTFELVE